MKYKSKFNLGGSRNVIEFLQLNFSLIGGAFSNKKFNQNLVQSFSFSIKEFVPLLYEDIVQDMKRKQDHSENERFTLYPQPDL